MIWTKLTILEERKCKSIEDHWKRRRIIVLYSAHHKRYSLEHFKVDQVGFEKHSSLFCISVILNSNKEDHLIRSMRAEVAGSNPTRSTFSCYRTTPSHLVREKIL